MDQSSHPAQARAVIDSVILCHRFGVEVFASLFPALTVILGGKRMPGTEDGPGPLQARPSRQRYGGDRRPAEAGQPDLAAAARP